MIKEKIQIEQEALLEKQIIEDFKEAGITIDSQQYTKLLPKIEKRCKKRLENEKKIENIEKLSLPDLKEKLIVLKDIYDKRNPNEILGFKLNKFPFIESKLNGLRSGFYLIGADSNIGKTFWEINIALDVLLSNENVLILFFTLDDDETIILNRMLSNLANIDIDDVEIPANLDKEKQMSLEKAYSILRNHSENLFIIDSEKVRTFSELEHFITLAKEKNKDKKLVVFVDAIFNIDVEESSLKEARSINIARANKFKALSNKMKIPLLCTIELIKNKGDETPQKKHIMESGKYVYNANLIWLLHTSEQDQKLNESPITLIWIKNKLSGFKGTTGLTFLRNKGIILENEADIRSQKPKDYDDLCN